MPSHPLLAIAAGAVLGAWLRYGLSVWLNARHLWLPLGTLTANLVGGFAIGFLLQLAERGVLSAEWRLFAVTGLLGALTTFSTFSAEVVALLQRGAWLEGLLLSSTHLFGSLLLTAIGWALARWLIA